MKVEELFLTVEQCKHLQKLGLDMSDAAFCWMIHPTNKKSFVTPTQTAYLFIGNQVPTYTLQEVLEKLPENIEVGQNYTSYNLIVNYHCNFIGYRCGNGGILHRVNFKENTILQAAYEMLCWVLEQGYYKEEDK